MRRRLPAVGLVLIALLVVGCGGNGSDAEVAGTAGDPPAGETSGGERAQADQALRLKLVTVTRGLQSPVAIASTPTQKKRVYVVEQEGRIRIVQGARVLSGAFLDIRGLVSCCGLRGLLSMAFHPRFALDGLFYVNYTDNGGDTRVVEYRRRAGRAPARVRELLHVPQPYGNHNGGQLQFGPDDKLYVGMGDGGSGGDPQNRAQNLSTRLGKLLRGNVDAPKPGWEIVGYGLRNPWRFSFDRKTGDLYIGDVGQNQWEEIDFMPASSSGRKNYGWDVYEGNDRFEDKEPSGGGELVFPIFEYEHGSGCSVTGGYVYRGSKAPAAQGRYFFGDYCSGTIWSLVVRGGKATAVKRHAFKVEGLTSFGEGPTGELYATGSGTLYRIAKR